MFNWRGKHKIGILGARGSGKTVFLTSLLWHLQDQKDDFKIGPKGEGKISDFKIIEDHDFGFESHKNTFTQEHKWPKDTRDFSVVTCSYHQSDCFCERRVSFVDIPGERVSDILLWTAKNYGEWVNSLYSFWQENPQLKEMFDPYWEQANNTGSSVEDIKFQYKKIMVEMRGKQYVPVTPSTILLNEKGELLGEGISTSWEEVKGPLFQKVKENPIWSGGDFWPVPERWKEMHPEKYKELEKNFKKYKKRVLKPLFEEIHECDNFIVCIDILQLLASGSGLLLQTRYEIKSLFDYLIPGKLKHIFNTIGSNPPRLVFAATKSDMVLPSQRDNLKYLLEDLVNQMRSSRIKTEYFICSSCVSTKQGKNKKGEEMLIGDDIDSGKTIEVAVHLPDKWADRWGRGEYIFQEVSPYRNISAVNPPQQVNLDRIFQFVVEDITYGNEK